jgi:hypothetical protein
VRVFRLIWALVLVPVWVLGVLLGLVAALFVWVVGCFRAAKPEPEPELEEGETAGPADIMEITTAPLSRLTDKVDAAFVRPDFIPSIPYSPPSRPGRN